MRFGFDPSSWRWRHHPLWLYAAIGSMLFVLNMLVSRSPDGDVIRIDEGVVQPLADAWQQQVGRPLNNDEMTGLLRNWVREEMLYREALRLGLDRDDTIIRRRLVQKLEFLWQQQLSGQPDEAALRTFYRNHSDRYRRPASYSFSQLYFSDQHGDQLQRMERALRTLRRGGKRDSVQTDIFMLNQDYADQSQAQIAGLFGEAFANALVGLPPNRWHGPVTSSYGKHLVVLRGVRPAELPAMGRVGRQLVQDYQQMQREGQSQRYLQKLRLRYQIVAEEPWRGLLRSALDNGK